ncbi:MAG: SDH family Clp fold serine proteinase [Gemmatimonadaceae bacterium]
MARAERKALIAQIEEMRGSKVLCYVTGDRAPTASQIGDDAVRPMYEHLRTLKKVDKLDFFIYSRGGAMDVPWRFVSAFRHAADQWNILVPFRANSAATLIALGADEIVLGAQGELGPIDPIMSVMRLVPGPAGQGSLAQDNIPVEDVMAYVRFVQERAGLSDQTALVASLSKLLERIDAVALGNMYRTHSHIRDVARRILLSRKTPAPERVLATIIETLAEKVYAHGHAIDAKTAKDIGLPVVNVDDKLDALMWALLNDYETELRLLSPIDPMAAIAGTDLYTEPATIAVLESAALIHEFKGEMQVRAMRQMPPTLNVSMSLQIAAPPLGPDGQPVMPPPQYLQQLLGQAQPALMQIAQEAVNEALRNQAPIQGVQASFVGGSWVRSA